MSVKIIYNNFPLIDKTSSIMETSDIQDYADVTKLKSSISVLPFSSFEQKYMSVDEDYYFYTNNDIGYVSLSQSLDTGFFNDSPYITITFIAPISTDGITLYFSPLPTEYCDNIILTYKKGETTVATLQIYPDSNIYTYRQTVNNYDKIIIKFKKTHEPFHWARLYRIDFGEQIVYEGDDVYGSTLTESADVTACQMEVNTSTVSVRASQSFQKGQNFEIWFNGKLYANHFLKSAIKQKDRYTLNGVDYLDKLGDFMIPAEYVNDYHESPYLTFMSYLSMFVQKPLLNAKVDIPIYVEESVQERYIVGAITEQVSCRNALLYICFAAGAYVDTTRTDKLYIRDAEKALSKLKNETYVYERNIFAGDTIEIKTPYKYVRVKYKDKLGNDKSESKTNPLIVDTTTAKEFNAPFVRYPNAEDTLIVAALYYFNNVFYQAKSVLSDEKIMSRVGLIPTDIDNMICGFAERLVLNLDGDKLIGDVRYKVV